MTSATLKISEEDLKNYAIVFSPQSNEKFFQNHFYRLTNRERDALLGYRHIGSNAAGSCSLQTIKKGRYPAHRIKLMCIKEKIDPCKIKTRYETYVETIHKHKHSPVKVDKLTEDLVWEAIGDGL